MDHLRAGDRSVDTDSEAARRTDVLLRREENFLGSRSLVHLTLEALQRASRSATLCSFDAIPPPGLSAVLPSSHFSISILAPPSVSSHLETLKSGFELIGSKIVEPYELPHGARQVHLDESFAPTSEAVIRKNKITVNDGSFGELPLDHLERKLRSLSTDWSAEEDRASYLMPKVEALEETVEGESDGFGRSSCEWVSDWEMRDDGRCSMMERYFAAQGEMLGILRTMFQQKGGRERRGGTFEQGEENNLGSQESFGKVPYPEVTGNHSFPSRLPSRDQEQNSLQDETELKPPLSDGHLVRASFMELPCPNLHQITSWVPYFEQHIEEALEFILGPVATILQSHGEEELKQREKFLAREEKKLVLRRERIHHPGKFW